MDWLTTALFAPIPSEFFKLNAALYGSQHNNRFRICYAKLTLFITKIKIQQESNFLSQV
ncbi:hypothetical protein LEP1GSC170_5551 [Leptospira interrogans serovar Bataviae str. HAI135]|nr:hypothetical protein LEP1GSC170_5551 [Leptospira interrogans serovar Bataviae str. HAI135]